MADIQILPENRFSLAFPYDEDRIAQIKLLADRRWNPEDKRWELPIGQLGTVLRLFRLESADLDKKVLRAWQLHQIRAKKVHLQSGNLTTTLVGDGLPLEKIDALTSFFVPGYRYMPRFKKGQWDGKKHLFNSRKKTLPTGLVPRVAALLEQEGIVCQVQSTEVAEQSPLAETSIAKALESVAKPMSKSARGKAARKTSSSVEFRDYQTECIAAAVAGKRGVLQLATGGGKTLIAAEIIRRIDRPAMFLVHTRDLLHQTRAVLSDYLGMPIGQAGDGVVSLQHVTVATVQTCARALDVKITKTPEDDELLETDRTDLRRNAADLVAYIRQVPVVFFDECHHLPADTTYDLSMQMEGASWRFGLSATPYRADRMDLLLEAALGPELFAAAASALIDKGYLVPPKIRFLPMPALIVRSGKADYQDIFSSYVVENPRRNQLIADTARELAAKGNSVLILVSQVRQGELLQRLLPDVPLVQGADAAERRGEVFAALGRKELPIAIATTLADEGLDVPSLNAVILASAGRSETRALQRVGRALRPSPKKKHAVIIDFMDDAPFLKEHAQRRLQIFKSEPAFEVKVIGK
ncbi:MAG: DEAD/DEAH box helicase [Candidatus Sumerlaeaceae bacterium]